MSPRKSPYNPSDRMNNCVACVAACLVHRMTGRFVDADALDRIYNITQQLIGTRDKKVILPKALALMIEATKLDPVPNNAGKPYRLVDPPLPKGHYALFIMGQRSANALVYEQEMTTYHVVYGQVGADAGGFWTELYDPQIDARVTGGHLVPPTYAVLFEQPD